MTSVAYLTDALGSTVALAKNGAAQTFYGYDPFGVQATPTGVADSNPYAFTGAQLDVTGLQYERHRYYSPARGRFISEDPLGLIGGINRYRYTDDAPTAERDPTGYCPACVGAIAGFSLDLAAQLYNSYQNPMNNGQSFLQRVGQLDAAELDTPALAGATGGILGGLTDSIALNAGGGAIINTAAQALKNALCGKPLGDNLTWAGAVGGVLGGAAAGAGNLLNAGGQAVEDSARSPLLQSLINGGSVTEASNPQPLFGGAASAVSNVIANLPF